MMGGKPPATTTATPKSDGQELKTAARPPKTDIFDGKEPASPVGIRYGTRRMAEIWGWPNYTATLLAVEAASSEAIAQHNPDKVTPAQAAQIKERANIRDVPPAMIEAKERVTHHDIGAVSKSLAEVVGPEAGGVVHFTLTSADVTEAAKAVQLKRALEVLIESAERLRDTLLVFAMQHRDVVAITRTHGQHALPASFGYPFANFASALQKHILRLNSDIELCIEGKMSGAIGTYDTASDEGMDGRAVERTAMGILGIRPSEISMQTPPREVISFIMSDLSSLAMRIHTIGAYIKQLKVTELGEVVEMPDPGTMASSAMLHKSKYGNPHVEERNSSLANVLLGFAVTGQVSQHSLDLRDLTGSASDRIILGSAFHLVDHAAESLENIVQRLELVPANIERNLTMLGGVETSPRVMSRLISKGVPRREAEKLVGLAADEVLSSRFGRKGITRREAEKLVAQAAKEVQTGAVSLKEALLSMLNASERGKITLEEALLKIRNTSETPLYSLTPEEIHELTDIHTYTGNSRQQVVRIARKYRGKRSHPAKELKETARE